MKLSSARAGVVFTQGWVVRFLPLAFWPLAGFPSLFEVDVPEFFRCLYRLLVSRLIPAGGNLGSLFNSLRCKRGAHNLVYSIYPT